MRILITGGTGFLGRALCRALLDGGHALTVLSRRPDSVRRLCGAAVTPLAALEAWPSEPFDAVVNLAGAPIAARRWSADRRAVLRASRVAATERLVAACARAGHPPAVLLSASAIGLYGDRGDAWLGEDEPAADDFLGGLCRDWEAAAQAAGALGTRVCLLRTGLVLHPSGGLLRMLLPAFRLGLGARLGNGRHWQSWIHLEDWLGLTLRLLADGRAEGAFNLTAPEPVTQAAFTAALAGALRRPAWAVAPAGLLRALLGERAQLLLASQRCTPRRAVAAGYRFRHPRLEFGKLLNPHLRSRSIRAGPLRAPSAPRRAADSSKVSTSSGSTPGW